MESRMTEEEIKQLKNKIDFSAMFADDPNVSLGFDAARKLIEYLEEKIKEYESR